jgi:hypothetical protein
MILTTFTNLTIDILLITLFGKSSMIECFLSSNSAVGERSFSPLERLKNYLRNSQSQDRLSSLALMNIEKSFLNKLQSKPSFLDEVIDLLAMKNRRIEQNYEQ